MIAFVAVGLAGATSGGISVAGQPGSHTEEQAPAAPYTPHGFVQIVGEALSEVSLRPDQEAAVEALGKQIEPLQARVDDAEKGLLLALADQVQIGRVDRDALAPFVTAYAGARQEVSGELRAAFEELHDLLDAGQREDLADAIESRVHDVRRAILAGEQLDDLAQQLDLTDAQKEALREGLQQIAPVLEHERVAIHQAIEGFRGDAFSVEQYLPQSQVFERAWQRADRIIDLTGAFVSLLAPVQREKLAARIREAAKVREDEPVESGTEEHIGVSRQPLWAAAGVRRGPLGGVRAGAVVGGSRGYAYRRAAAYPYAAGWGYGW
jgi:hypothetical protein